MNLQQYVTHILTLFYEQLSNCRRTYPFFQQDSVKIQTTRLCFIQRLYLVKILRGLWPPNLPDLNT